MCTFRRFQHSVYYDWFTKQIFIYKNCPIILSNNTGSWLLKKIIVSAITLSKKCAIFFYISKSMLPCSCLGALQPLCQMEWIMGPLLQMGCCEVSISQKNDIMSEVFITTTIWSTCRTAEGMLCAFCTLSGTKPKLYFLYVADIRYKYI